ncbi:MAG: amidohydrolase family protein [Candidatus Binatia bacterium]|nr:amidohydrolase family protein [Candidatus Binatia bacterium]
MTTASGVAAIKRQLDHPVIDSDGHYIEFLPEVKERLRSIAGNEAVEGFEQIIYASRLSESLDAAQRRQLALTRIPFWALPARQTVDRATSMMPKLLHERLDEFGLDFAVLYPTYGLVGVHLVVAEQRQALCRAFNEWAADAFAPHGDRLTPVASIPMHSPEEAIAELDHAVGTLGMRAVMMAGFAMRPFEGENLPRGATWLDTFGLDSPYDYDPVWKRCEELGISPTFHSTGMGWGTRVSTTNYVANHVGSFAAAQDGICRALFMGGVPWRFPKLRFAFLEGGVNWARGLYSDLIGHWSKRNKKFLPHYDPANLDRGEFEKLLDQYGSESMRAHRGRLDEALCFLSDPETSPETTDDFARCAVERAEDIRDVFVHRFHFGCEADDPMNAGAFDTRLNPLGARMKAFFSSDIGHWDVPDMSGVLGEAYEMVEHGFFDIEDFRDFVFSNPVSLWCGTNPDFFRGTRVESAVEHELARSGPD